MMRKKKIDEWFTQKRVNPLSSKPHIVEEYESHTNGDS